jgi:hypothetical protein
MVLACTRAKSAPGLLAKFMPPQLDQPVQKRIERTATVDGVADLPDKWTLLVVNALKAGQRACGFSIQRLGGGGHAFFLLF